MNVHLKVIRQLITGLCCILSVPGAVYLVCVGISALCGYSHVWGAGFAATLLVFAVCVPLGIIFVPIYVMLLDDVERAEKEKKKDIDKILKELGK